MAVWKPPFRPTDNSNCGKMWQPPTGFEGDPSAQIYISLQGRIYPAITVGDVHPLILDSDLFYPQYKSSIQRLRKTMSWQRGSLIQKQGSFVESWYRGRGMAYGSLWPSQVANRRGFLECVFIAHKCNSEVIISSNMFKINEGQFWKHLRVNTKI